MGFVERLCGGSPLWDSEQSWNTTQPVLSRCFTETVLVIIPAAFLWLFVPYMVFDAIRSGKNKINWNFYNTTRLTIAIACACVTIIDLIWCFVLQFEAYDTTATSHQFATVVKTITKLLLCCIFYFHRTHGFQNSGTVWFYLLLETVLDAFAVASNSQSSSVRQTHEYTLFIIEYILVVTIFVLCSFNDKPPPNLFGDNLKGSQNICPKFVASFPSKLTYWWFNALAIKGWKSPLTVDDLWPIRADDKCDNLFKWFNKYWKHPKFGDKPSVVRELNGDSVKYKNNSINLSAQTVNKPNLTKLWTMISKAFWFYFLAPCVIKLVADLVQLTNPMILKLLIGFAMNVHEPNWHGYVYALLLVLTNLFQSFILTYHAQRMAVLGMRIRTCIISAVYRKSLILSNNAKKDSTTGEIVNLMSVDAQRFVDLLPWITILWTAPIQMAITLWLLWNELGAAVIGGIVVMIAVIPINGIVMGKVRTIQVQQMKLKDQRLKAMNEVLSGIKVLKLYAWEEAFIEKILGIRADELKLLRKSGYMSSIFWLMMTTSPFLVSLVSFAIYVLSSDTHILTAQKAFVSISLFNILRMPLTMIPNMANSLVMTIVSVKRLNKFLNSSELSSYVTRNDDKDMITIKNGSFVWDTEDKNNVTEIKLTLENINLRVEKRKFVAIVGVVGSGKSSLLSTLLGEMEKLEGSVNIDGSSKIAYVPQQAWIQNATLKNNILFGTEYDRKTYTQVIRSCALQQDIAVLSGGDDTEIGEKGINLSGGQKQRVSLARACYSDADLYLLDDPLSAVDSHVGKHIMEEVLSSSTGLLRNKTRVLVTNSLFVLPEVDLIVVLKSGRVTDMGTYSELMDKKGDFYELINQYSANKTEEDDNTEVDSKEESATEIVSRKRASTVELPSNAPQKKMLTKLVENETTETGVVKLSVYKKYANARSLFWTVWMILFAVTQSGLSAGSSFWLADWTEDSNTSRSRTIYRLVIYAVFGLGQGVFVTLMQIANVCGTILASSSLHAKLLNAIMHAPMMFFDTTPLGRVLNRLSKDIDILDTILMMTIGAFMNTGLVVLSTIVIISVNTPYFLIVVTPVTIVYYFFQKFYVVTTRQLKRLESVTRSPIYTHFSETINGVSTIRAYNVNDRFIRESNARVDANQVCYYPNAVASSWLQVRLQLLSNCLIFAAALFAVLSKGKLNPGDTGQSISYALSITMVLNVFVRMFAEFENNVVAVERIDEYCNIEQEADWHRPHTQPQPDWPHNGVIRFDRYATRYRPGLDLVLKGIDVNVNKGEKVGIVGRTGAGKSSLTLALFRLIEASNGRITIDGVDISGLGLQDLRSRLTIIPQDPVLFAGTIRSNLDPFKEKSDEQLWLALEHSHLKAFVTSLETGLEHNVSEGGDNLSVGQRQLICLARALLRNTKILILDEATAAVDLETDALIQNTIRTEFASHTVLTIAHRLHTILDADRVLVLDDGRVAEFASPNTLLANNYSIFYSLAKDAGIV